MSASGGLSEGASGGGTGGASDTGGAIDAALYVTWRSVNELKGYLPPVWQNRLGSGRGAPRIQPAYYVPLPTYDKEAAAPEGGPPGSDPDLVIRDWLDCHNLAHAVLLNYDVPVISTWGDADYPAAIARAYNEWLVERWLARDSRFLGAMVVATQDPLLAAEEIDRIGGHPQIVQVLLASGARQAYGVRTFHPIYEAAARHGLHIAIQIGTEGLGTSNPPTSAGWPTYSLEWRACQAQNLAAHMVSLVTEGVFVQHPKLKLVLLGGGAAWLPQLLWRLDKNFKPMRLECPWLTEMPSAYILRHVRFITYGIEQPEQPEHLWTYLRLMEGERTLLYGSGYPRWEMEAPEQSVALGSATPEARRRITRENARELYRLVAGRSVRSATSRGAG